MNKIEIPVWFIKFFSNKDELEKLEKIDVIIEPDEIPTGTINTRYPMYETGGVDIMGKHTAQWHLIGNDITEWYAVDNMQNIRIVHDKEKIRKSDMFLIQKRFTWRLSSGQMQIKIWKINNKILKSINNTKEEYNV